MQIGDRGSYNLKLQDMKLIAFLEMSLESIEGNRGMNRLPVRTLMEKYCLKQSRHQEVEKRR